MDTLQKTFLLFLYWTAKIYKNGKYIEILFVWQFLYVTIAILIYIPWQILLLDDGNFNFYNMSLFIYRP